MKAFEARQQSINPMYEKIISGIKAAITDGETATLIHSNIEPLPQEVITMLLDDGYDILLNSIKGENYIRYTYTAIWTNAEEGKKGNLSEQTHDLFASSMEVLDSIFKISKIVENRHHHCKDDCETLEDILNSATDDSLKELGIQDTEE